jgi:hypothetical protein
MLQEPLKREDHPTALRSWSDALKWHESNSREVFECNSNHEIESIIAEHNQKEASHSPI